MVTSGVTALATTRLTASGLPVPRLLITADIDIGTPAPDGYLAAARGLGLSPERTVVLAHSPAGIAAAVTDLTAVCWSPEGLALTSGNWKRRSTTTSRDVGL